MLQEDETTQKTPKTCVETGKFQEMIFEILKNLTPYRINLPLLSKVLLFVSLAFGVYYLVRSYSMFLVVF